MTRVSSLKFGYVLVINSSKKRGGGTYIHVGIACWIVDLKTSPEDILSRLVQEFNNVIENLGSCWLSNPPSLHVDFSSSCFSLQGHTMAAEELSIGS